MSECVRAALPLASNHTVAVLVCGFMVSCMTDMCGCESVYVREGRGVCQALQIMCCVSVMPVATPQVVLP